MPNCFTSSNALALSLAALTIVGCAGMTPTQEPAVEGASSPRPGAAHGESETTSASERSGATAPAPAMEESPSTEVGSEEQVRAKDERARELSGVLTAGTWDDNLNLDSLLHFRETLQRAQVPGLLPLEVTEHEDARFTAVREPRRTLDVSLVIDATGSMGDEIAYLKAEFSALNARLHERYPNAKQRWSLVMYRDMGDEYVVRDFDFNTDPEAFQTRLEQQSADGGGDYPEAPERGLAKALTHEWRQDKDTARLVFWVADAPHHAENNGEMASAIRRARQADVRIYPVASSGVDDITEFTMRSAAQLTGGRYVFLTDDSGVGVAHEEPRIPCYEVTRLDAAIFRMIETELSGRYQQPAKSEVLRTVGSPSQGRCAAETVTAAPVAAGG